MCHLHSDRLTHAHLDAPARINYLLISHELRRTTYSLPSIVSSFTLGACDKLAVDSRMGNDGVPETMAEVMAVAAVDLTDASNWWNDIDDSPVWQDRIFYTLAVLYGIVATVALVSSHTLSIPN